MLESRQQRVRAKLGPSAGQVVHCAKDEYDVYIGRPSKWGNPFKLSDDPKNRAIVLEAYRKWLRERPELLADAVEEILGKVLGCWCAPHKVCHGHVLIDEALAFQRSMEKDQ